MTLLVLASGTDIAQWAGTRAAQERLPELLRRLVYATTQTPTYVDFPAGEAVQLEGYDGVVELDEDHATIPPALSVWEVGANANPKGKADEDYEKRTASPPDMARGPVTVADTTFVFVTPRRWRNKDKWAKSRRAEKIWRDVRAIDADDLEAWLQQAAATHIWLSRLLGLLPGGADDLETVWADWAEGVTPPATPDFVLAGRREQSAEITKWLAGGRGTFTVVAESIGDAIGVLAASIVSLPEPQRIPILSRTVVVSNGDALTQLAGSSEPLIIIVAYAAGNEIQRATRAGHQVVLPVGPVPAFTPSPAHAVIPRIQRQDAEKALVAMGVSPDRARDLAGIARRSMLTLRRRLATNPALQAPRWSDPSIGPSLVPMLLAGQFDESSDADLQALAALAPAGLRALQDVLLRWSQEIDPPVRRVGTTWYLVSKEDAWAVLSRFVSAEDLTRFAGVAKDVLGEVHPKFDLPPEQRWAANIHGKVRQYSSTLASGIADTIALLGSLEDSAPLQGNVSPSEAADRIVGELFDRVAGDWRGWATLSRVLPLLAEGSPDVFLKAVEAQIAKDEDAVRKLFQDEGDLFFSASSHTGLLWALETLAWSPDHIAYTSRLLATLARLDPGGRISNRPSSSLRSIFLSWLPQTSASLDTRLEVLNQLRAHEPKVSWFLFASLLPRLHDHSGDNPRPRWRDWVSEGAGTGATYRDIFRQTSQVVTWMIQDAGDDVALWVTLIESLGNIGSDEFDAVTTALGELLARPIDDEARAGIFDALRETLSRHRSFPDLNWSLPADRLARLEPLLEASTPSDTFLRVRWLFTNRPQLPEGREGEFEQHAALVLARQKEAVRELYDERGGDGIIALATRVEQPDDLGRVLALAGMVTGQAEERLLERLLGATDAPTFAMGRGYTYGWTVRLGEAAAFSRVRDERAWSDRTRGRLLLSHEPTAATLDVIDSLNGEGQLAFWSGVQPFWLKEPVVQRGLRGVLEHGRAHAFVDAAAMHLRKHPDLDPELLAKGLEQAPRSRSDANGFRMDAHDVSQVLDALERAVHEGRFDEERLAQIEFLYLPILGHFERPPRILHGAMAKNASLFVQAVRTAYPGSGEERENRTPDQTRLVERAYHLLQSWRVPPGTKPNGIDEPVLIAWVDRARDELRAEGRLLVGEELIGEVLSEPAADTDGAWPRIPIRNLIERLESDRFELGLQIGRYNSRGVISRNPLSGGDLERGEAAAYERMASTVATRWPRTAALLRRMARSAHADATREDAESELREDLDI